MIFLAVASFALSLVLTPLVRNFALRRGLVDRPDNNRKLHKVAVPRIGGVAVVAASVGGYALLAMFGRSSGILIWQGNPVAIRLLAPVLIVFSIGLIDDLRELPPWLKLSSQAFAAILAWAAGIRLTVIAGYEVPAIVSFLLTTLWMVGCSNAINLIDGVDGLASGAALFATVTMFVSALFHQNLELAFATISLAGALLGFLRFNFSPASIFLGDCGSLTLGFLLGCYGILWTEKSTTLLGMTAPLIVLLVPFLDVVLAIVRRYMRRQPIFKADREHIHHKLLSQGLPPWRVVVILYGCCGLAGLAGLILTSTQVEYRGLVIITVFVIACLGIQRLGYLELDVAGKVFFEGRFHGLLNARRTVLKFEQELLATKTLEDTWQVLCKASSEFGFSGVEWSIDGELRVQRAVAGRDIRFDFPGRGYVVLTRESSATVSSGYTGALFIDCVDRMFFERLRELHPTSSNVAILAQNRLS